MTRVVPALALALVLALGADVWAGPPTDTLRDAFAAVNRLLADPRLAANPDEVLAEIRGVVSDRFDFREAARRALGQEWETRTAAEQDQFVRLFADLLRHAYLSGLAARARVQGGLEVRYGDETIDGDRASVPTTVGGRTGDEIPVEYRLLNERGRWAVYDVVVDGVSLVANYRAQFVRVIRNASYTELVAQMEAKTSEVPGGPVAAPPLAVAAVPAARPPAEARKDAIAEIGAGDDPRAAPARVARPPAARPALEPAGSYWVQVGAFTNAETAIRVAARLLELDLPVSLDAVSRPRGPRGEILARVRVGPFADPAEAASKLRNLRTSGYRPFIARETD